MLHDFLQNRVAANSKKSIYVSGWFVRIENNKVDTLY